MELDELLDDLVDAAGEIVLSGEWGTGGATAQREADELRKKIDAAIWLLRDELEQAATELSAARPIVEIMRSERFKVAGALQLFNNYDDAVR